MKLLFENWREYLAEGIKTLETLPEDMYINIFADGRGQWENIVLMKSVDDERWNDENIGQCTLEEIDTQTLWAYGREERADLLWDFELRHGEQAVDSLINRCKKWNKEYLLGQLYTLHFWVDREYQSEGYGPLLTDIALELATQAGKWIVLPDLAQAGVVSADAERVFDHYLDKRSDVQKKEIDQSCWGYHTGINTDDYPISSIYLYKKQPKIINSEFAKTKIDWLGD
jgi:GNAT superfamily N-acetyltransferase